jgi:hypothetical protein
MVAGGGIGVVVIALLVMVLGGDPSKVLQGAQQSGLGQSSEQSGPVDPNDPTRKFISKILKQTENVWNSEFARYGEKYQEPVLKIFSGGVSTGCGNASSEMGPFYCPADSTVYIDPSFYETMRSRLKADGDFAQAYVIAHEVGHHVQNLLGTSGKVDSARRRVSEREGNKLSVRLELQADFYAGLWARKALNLQIDQNDIREAVNAAHQIGDDTLQRNSQGYTDEDAFTHGTSEQRMRWFMKGYNSGDMRQGDTFSTESL